MGKFGISIPSVSIPTSVSGPVKNAIGSAKNKIKTEIPNPKDFIAGKAASLGINIPDVDSLKAQVLSQIPEADLNQLKAAGIDEDTILSSVKEQLPKIPTADQIKESVKNFKMPTAEDAKSYINKKTEEAKEVYSTVKDLKAIISGEGEISAEDLIGKELGNVQ